MPHRRAYSWLERTADRLVPVGVILTVVAFGLGAFAVMTLARRADENAKAVRLFCALELKLAGEIRRGHSREAKAFAERFPNLAGVIRQARLDDERTLVLMRQEKLPCD